MRIRNPALFMKIIKITYIIFLISLMVNFLSCSSGTTSVKIKPPAESVTGVKLRIPSDWKQHKSDYFQLIAIGFASNDYPAWIEYRGLETAAMPDENSKDLYATGWYEAITKNYPEWKSQPPQKISVNGQTVYEINGTYRVAGNIFHKIGRLRIGEKHVHAIYYTAYDIGFDSIQTYFNDLDKKHNFNY
jgi:hypothetical protein